MEQKFTKRIAVRLAAFAALAAVLLIGAGVATYNLISRYKNNLESKYQMSLNNLADYTTNIKTTLEKKGDWKPIVFLFTDGTPTDDPSSAFARLTAS